MSTADSTTALSVVNLQPEFFSSPRKKRNLLHRYLQEDLCRETFTLKNVATLLDVAPHRIVYLVTSRQVCEPALRVGNVRVWTRQDETIAGKLKTTIGEIAGKENDE